jgi:catechol 2,3-dioxygenase-like lactoylglutathione lyase family enzyme
MKIVDKLIQLMVGVTDMEKSKKFYADTLGFTVTTDYGQGKSHWVSLSFPDGGVTITLTTFLGTPEMGTVLQPGSMSLYLEAPDLQQSYDALAANGITPANPISDDLYGPGSGVKWFRLTDPDSNSLTIVQS